MASLKEIRKRILSVKSTQQITRAMKMVSAAKFKKAQNAILKIRPYSLKIKEVLAQLSDGLDDLSLNPFYQIRKPGKILLVVITSDKGLCGSFNGSVFREAISEVKRLTDLYVNPKIDFIVLGKKGYDFIRKSGHQVVENHFNLSGHVGFDEIEPIADRILGKFVNKEYDLVKVIFNTFKNPVVYIPTSEQFLPVIANREESKSLTKISPYYIFEPTEERIIEVLIPSSLKINFYRFVLESNASEQGARMTAMDKATENAEDLITQLKMTYNRVRQTTITNELLEIVSGANAMRHG